MTDEATLERLGSAARVVVAYYDHAASFETVNFTETARAMGAIAVWEAMTRTTGDAAIALARRIAEEAPITFGRAT